MVQAAGLGDELRRIFEELGKISLVDVVLPTRGGPKSVVAASPVPPITRRSSWSACIRLYPDHGKHRAARYRLAKLG